MDYRDAWLLDVFTGDRLHEPNSRAAKWEKKLVESAREVWFVNDPIKEWHEKLYPAQAAKMHTVANGFDPDLVPDTHDRGPVTDRPLVFGYVGTVSPKVPLAEFVEGWQIARSASEEMAGAQGEDPRLPRVLRAAAGGHARRRSTARPRTGSATRARSARRRSPRRTTSSTSSC